MKNCPDAITWQAVVDGEEKDPRLRAHLESCSACGALFRQIEAAAGLAGVLYTPAVLPPAVRRRMLKLAKPFPAGLVAALLFSLLAAAALMLDPGGFTWWLSVGAVRQWGFILDIAINVLLLLRSLDPLVILTAVLLLVAVEVVILYKFKLVEG